jgi:hypothetical protein
MKNWTPIWLACKSCMKSYAESYTDSYTCRRLLKSIFLLSVLHEIRQVNKDATNFDLCVLSFDEVKISEGVEYDHRTDQIRGPHRQAQVGMMRGLLYPYKQPIYVDFDKAMKKDILFDIITRLKRIGYRVVAIASDMGTSNVGLWRSLGVTDKSPLFSSPWHEDDKIFAFPDAPHLLKLYRNHLLDKGYTLPSGAIMKKEDLEKVLSADSGIKFCKSQSRLS